MHSSFIQVLVFFGLSAENENYINQLFLILLFSIFYKKYGYEPDEQSKEITDKSLHINTDSDISNTQSSVRLD